MTRADRAFLLGVLVGVATVALLLLLVAPRVSKECHYETDPKGIVTPHQVCLKVAK